MPEPEDEVKELGEQATSIVPGPKVNVVPAPEVPTPSGQPSPRPPGALGAAGAQADMPALPGALEEEEALRDGGVLGVMAPPFQSMEWQLFSAIREYSRTVMPFYAIPAIFKHGFNPSQFLLGISYP